MTVARRVGGVHLALAGTINAASGLAVLALSLSGWLLEAARFVSPATALRNGELLGFLATWVIPLVGLLLVALAVVQVFCGYHAYGGRYREWGVAAGLLGAVNVLALPVALIAAVLLGVPERD